MSERRHQARPGASERRSVPRPPLWLNLLLLAIAATTFAYAKHQRTIIDEKTATLFRKNENSPSELNRLREELAQMDLTKQQLGQELDSRMQYLQTLQSEQFYISIDTATNKFQFRLGKDVAREATMHVGDPKTIKSSDGKTWTFSALKGGFNVTGKDEDYESPVAEWVYALRGEKTPHERPTLRNWLGKYVIYLPNGYVIQSPPRKDSPLQGPKPGSFEVPEEDLAAIWPRISTNTRVYVF